MNRKIFTTEALFRPAIFLIILIYFFVSIIAPFKAGALSEDQKKVFGKGIRYYNVEQCQADQSQQDAQNDLQNIKPITLSDIKKLKNPLDGASAGGDIDPKAIVLHWWGNNPKKGIKPLVDTLRSRDLSVQFGVTHDGEIWQLTKKETTLSSHATGGNATSFGIEIEGGPSDFGPNGKKNNPKKFQAVSKLVAYLGNKYSIDLNKRDATCGSPEGLLSHKDFNKCPKAVKKDDVDEDYFQDVKSQAKSMGVSGVKFTDEMTVNTDGSGESHGNPNHQSQTSLKNGGEYLNADELNFIALSPKWAESKRLELGDIALVEYKELKIFAVYGDNWNNSGKQHGEGSYRMIKILSGKDKPNPNTSTIPPPVKYTIYPDSHEKLPSKFDQKKIDTLGKELSGADSTEEGATKDTGTELPAGCVCPSESSSSGSGGGSGEPTAGLSGEQAAFVDKYHDIAERLSIKYGIPWETVLAQGILESAAGSSQYAKERNNFFGIGAFDSNPDNAYRYASPEEGWEGYFKNIVKTPTYREHGVFKGDTITDPVAYLTAIKAAGYATDPDYISKVSVFISAIENRSSTKGWKSSADLARENPEMLANAAKYAAGGDPSAGGSSGSSGSSSVTCGGSSETIDEGGLTEEQAKKFMMNYGANKNNDSSKVTGPLWGMCNGGGSNCVTFAYFFNKKFTDLPAGPGDGNGEQIVSTLGRKGAKTGSKPKVFATFSWSNAGAGHVGIVLGIKGDTIIVGHASCSNQGRGEGDGTIEGGGSGFVKVGKADDPSVWIGKVPTEFAYPDKVDTSAIESYVGN